MNIYVGNLASTTIEEDLRELFGKHGQIESVKIIKDFDTGQQKGFAFVEMYKGGQSAIEALNETELNGNNILVSEAFERRNNNRGNYNRGGGGYRRDDRDDRRGGYR